jgi:ABC-type cobalamin/Fe3+-siderophores transport system ATPase subunit
MDAVTVRGLGWKYAGRETFAIDGVDLTIPQNAFVSVVGPNEHGKTTLVSSPTASTGCGGGRWSCSARTCASSPARSWPP